MLAIVAPPLLARLAGLRLRAAAHARHLRVHWSALDVAWPASLDVRDLVLVRGDGDTLLVAHALTARARLLSLLMLHPAVGEARLDDVRVRLHAGSATEDSIALETEDDSPQAGPPVAPSVQRAAQQLARALLAPARGLPTLHVAHARIERGDSTTLRLDALALEHARGGVHLAASGVLSRDRDMPFEADLRWAHDDSLAGRARFDVPEPDGASTPLVMTMRGRVTQDRHAGRLVVHPGTRVTVGRLALALEAVVDTHGPRITTRLALDSLSDERLRASLPRAVLGPLGDLDVRGSFDWRLAADLDLAHPDRVDFEADVIPHGLVLDETRSHLAIAALAQPFDAHIHLPHDRIVTRRLGPENPHFHTLDRISPFLRDALVTNEDGAFFLHRGFNTEAIKLAIAEDLRTGRFKRGAGTITMQLVRNLYLGHRRTLARKAQEVTLAWTLEHLSGLPKERLLELYLNIIEWGPDVHGADEAAHWYFDRDASELTLPEALFLTVVVPSPSKWRWRVTPDGRLRPWAQEQMHFIATKMAAKGWLDADAVPAAESLQVELRGPARLLLAGATATRDTTHAGDAATR